MLDSTTVEVTPPPSKILPNPSIGTEPAKKRRRLGPGAHGSLFGRKMEDLEVALEVDHMILDYLLYKAIEACFHHPHSSWDDQISPVERTLLQVDEFYALFKRRYSTYKLDAGIRFRQGLLQLVALFTQRLRRNSTTPGKASLERLREGNRQRAFRWIGSDSRVPSASFDVDCFDDQLPLPQDDLERNKSHVLQELGLPVERGASEDCFYGTSECVSLLDILPLLMKVSGTCRSMYNAELNEQWMQMATEMMLHVCLEQYLVFGATGTDAIDEAFAWGHTEVQEQEQEQDLVGAGVNDNDINVDAMFGDRDAEGSVSAWRDARDGAIRRIVSRGDRELAAHLMDLARQHSFSQMEASISSYLHGLSKIVPPVLLQLERGQLEDMTREETRAFMKECGLDVVSFYVGESAS